MNAEHNINPDTEDLGAIDESTESTTEATDVDIQEPSDAVPEIPDDYNGDSWNDNSDISSGDSGQTAVTVSGGDVSGSDVSGGDTGISSSGSGHRVTYSETQSPDYTDNLISLQESLDALHSTLFLILLFLLLSWTDKKITTAVHKFTRAKRK